MASKLTRSVFRSLKVGQRHYGAQVQAAVSTDAVQNNEPKVSKNSAGMSLVSLESSLPFSRLALVVKAGSRYENADELGMTHFIRCTSHLSTKQMSSFMLLKQIQQQGGIFKVSATREHLIYNLECPKGNLKNIADALRSIVSEPNYFEYELRGVEELLKFDVAMQQNQPNSRVYELLHQAAFRNGLGNTLYCPEHLTGSFTAEKVRDFMTRNFSADRMALVGIGVSDSMLQSIGEKYTQVPGDGSNAEASPATYYGGELREFNLGNETFAAVAAEGPSLASAAQYASGVLQMIVGSGSHVKWNSGSPANRLSNAVATATDNDCALLGLNVNYSDSGLFGFVVSGTPTKIEKGLKAAFQEFTKLTKASLTDKDVEMGKNKLKAAVSMYMEDGGNIATELGEQVLRNGKVTSLEEVFQAIDKVTAADVAEVAKKIVTGKGSMATIGNLGHAPYLDQLYK